MNKEDYFKYYIQGSDHYLIPKDVFIELFEEMENWKEEAKELKKQLEEYKEQVHKGLYNVCLPYKTGYNKAIKDKEIQQKEFIKWLEDYLNLFDNMDIDEQISYDTIEEILQKCKEIIGDDK